MSELTWTCHVCGEERPDVMISVFSRRKTIGPVEFQENIRHCIDKQTCIDGARDVTFTGKVAEDVSTD